MNRCVWRATCPGKPFNFCRGEGHTWCKRKASYRKTWARGEPKSLLHNIATEQRAFIMSYCYNSALCVWLKCACEWHFVVLHPHIWLSTLLWYRMKPRLLPSPFKPTVHYDKDRGKYLTLCTFHNRPHTTMKPQLSLRSSNIVKAFLHPVTPVFCSIFPMISYICNVRKQGRHASQLPLLLLGCMKPHETPKLPR